MPKALYLTDSDEANELLARDPLALLIGFALDQQVSVPTAFLGPLKVRDRLGSLDAGMIAALDPAKLEAAFRERPAVHRFPGAMAKRVQELCTVVVEDYEGDAARIWTEASDASDLRKRIGGLPGFGEMKITGSGSVLALRFGVEAAQELVPDHPCLGGVDSPEALAEYQAAKRAHKAALRSAAATGDGRPDLGRVDRDHHADDGGQSPADVAREVARLPLEGAHVARDRALRRPLRDGRRRARPRARSWPHRNAASPSGFSTTSPTPRRSSSRPRRRPFRRRSKRSPIPTRGVAGVPDLMHHKFVVRDGEAVWTGSTNWTDDSWSRQENVIVTVESREIAYAYTLAFGQLWESGVVEHSGDVDPRPEEVGDLASAPGSAPSTARRSRTGSRSTSARPAPASASHRPCSPRYRSSRRSSRS